MKIRPSELFRPVRQRPARWYLTPLWVLVLGIISIALLWTTHVKSVEQTAQEFLVDNALTHVETAVAVSHLWLEEYLMGDESIELEQIRRDLTVAGDRVSLVLRGGELMPDGPYVEPLRDPGLRARAEVLREQLRELEKQTLDRAYRGGEAGTTIDQQYDEVFHQLLQQSRDLRLDLEARWARQQASASVRLRSVMVAWIVVVGVAVAGLWSRERRRLHIEDALRTSQKWLATTLASIGDGVITTDLRGRVTFLNPVAEELTGWTLAEAVERDIEEIFQVVDELDARPVKNPLLQVLRSGGREELSNHTVLNAHDGERHFINHSAAPIAINGGQLLGAVLVFRDISKRKRAEAALHQREAELRQAQKMEAVGRLAGGIAHDINNFLGAIRGYCEVAKMKGESGEALARRMDGAIETTESISALIQQLLAFSRRQPVDPEVVDLNRVVQDLSGMLEHLIGEDVRLASELSEDLAAIEIDPSQVEQILVNLLVNARDAMPRGGEILVRTLNVDGNAPELVLHGAEPAVYVCLEVRDTGNGIPPEVREKIFEPFFSTKDRHDRSGLGLSTVYGIVQQNAGFIDVASEVGQGTTFRIYFPACGGVPTVVEEPSRTNLEALRLDADILLVEDNEAMRRSTRELLETLGHRVRVAASGEEALELLAANDATDLVITDVIMPGLSGKELVDHVRKTYPRIRCLFISGYTDQVTLRHGLSQERVDFLAKPFSSKALARKIRDMLMVC